VVVKREEAQIILKGKLTWASRRRRVTCFNGKRLYIQGEPLKDLHEGDISKKRGNDQRPQRKNAHRQASRKIWKPELR